MSKKNDSTVKLFEPNIDINSEVYLEQYIKILGEDKDDKTIDKFCFCPFYKLDSNEYEFRNWNKKIN